MHPLNRCRPDPVDAIRVPPAIRKDYDEYTCNVRDAAIWLGLATWMTGNMQGAVKRDSGASGLKALQYRQLQGALKTERQGNVPIRLPSDGGHLLVADGRWQWCALCGAKGSLTKIGRQLCPGTKAEKLVKRSFDAKVHSGEH